VVNRLIRARDFQDVRAIKSLHIEKIGRRKAGIRSARINKQYRLEFVHDKEHITIRLMKISEHYE
jgi:plasmid maintenance system killer protein